MIINAEEDIYESSVSVWSIADGRIIKTFASKVPTPAGNIAINSAGKLLAISGNNSQVRILDLRTEEPVQLLVGSSAVVQGLAFLPNDCLVTANSDSTLLVWDFK